MLWPPQCSPRRSLGGLDDRREFDLATLEVLGRFAAPPALLLFPTRLTFAFVCGFLLGSAKLRVAKPRVSLLAESWPRETSCGTFISSMSTGVISSGSTSGMGRHLSKALETIPCHCGGSPTYFCSW